MFFFDALQKNWDNFFVRNWFPFWLRGCWLGELVGCGCAISLSFYPQAAEKLDSLHFVNFQQWTSYTQPSIVDTSTWTKKIFNPFVLWIIIELVISRQKPYKFPEHLQNRTVHMDTMGSRASLARPGGCAGVQSGSGLVAWRWLETKNSCLASSLSWQLAHCLATSSPSMSECHSSSPHESSWWARSLLLSRLSWHQDNPTSGLSWGGTLDQSPSYSLILSRSSFKTIQHLVSVDIHVHFALREPSLILAKKLINWEKVHRSQCWEGTAVATKLSLLLSETLESPSR